MKHLKKWLALTLAAVLVMGMLPSLPHAHAEEIPEDVQAEQPQPEEPAAEEPAAEEPEPESGTWTWVNPAFPDAQIPDTEPMGMSNAEPQAYDLVTKSQAIEAVREQLKNRTGGQTLWFRHDTEMLKTVLEEIGEEVLKHTGEPDEGDYILWNLKTLKFSYSKTFNKYTGNFAYEVSVSATYLTTAEQEEAVDDAVSAAVSNLGVRYKSDYKKICAVYDYLCDNVTYLKSTGDNTKLRSTAYGAIVEKTADSYGFALLAYRMLLELDVDIRIVAGLKGDEEHGWNIVELNDLYYNMDAALDAGSEEHQWLLKGASTFTDYYRYMDYETLDFHSKHLMALNDYEAGEDGEPIPYVAAGICGESIWWTLSLDGKLELQGFGPMYDYTDTNTSGCAPWSLWKTEIKEITIGEGITYVGDYAFKKQTALERVTLPSTMEALGDVAFGGSGLKTINIPDSLTVIDGACFIDCVNLTDVDLTNGVQVIGGNAFKNCDSLTSVSLSGTVTECGKGAFNDCDGLESVHIDIEIIQPETFYGCSMTELTLTDRVQSIGNDAFAYCTNLEEVVLPDSITFVTGFYHCSSLRHVMLPANATEIGEKAFYEAGLVSVTIPDSVKVIGKYAFNRCEELEEVILPEYMESLGWYAFEYTAIRSVVVPEGIQELSGVFENCRELESVVLPSTLVKIGYSTF